jgi:IclR family KDG regulon transcriptional repressor
MRCGADTKAHYVALLKEAGRAISAQLGYQDSVRAPD